MHEALHPLWVFPFVLLLGSIAVLPLLAPHFWHKRYPLVAIVLGLVVAVPYLTFLGRSGHVTHALREYFSFVVIMGALFTAAGGIHLEVKGHATPLINCLFLGVGSVLASLIGTTGASMVMIRPWIRMNRPWIKAFHVVLFIFVVSNIGGALTPIGDPPLFLGFLRGVPFFWTVTHLWKEWLIGTLWVIAVFYVLDARSRPAVSAAAPAKAGFSIALRGRRNLVCLAAVVGAAFITRPVFLREAVMIAAGIAAWVITPRQIHRENNFVLAPLYEVAVLFFGIFLTMMPALEWLEAHAAGLGISSPLHFFWGSGTLSAVLDNAPTYLNFLSVASGLFAAGAISDAAKVALLLAERPEIVKAISAGCVFFGAMTYIGNGPNFLVKSVAEHEKIGMASFFGYVIRYSVPVLLPLFALISMFSF